MKKGVIYIILSLLLPLSLQAQESTSSYDVLKLPVSSHASALGGDNISNVEDRPDVGWSNPALLSGVTDYSVGFNFMTYGAGSKYLGFQGVKAVGQRHTVALMGQLMNYGEMKETDEQGNTLGTFNANDIILAVGYSYLLSDRWAGGANVKMACPSYSSYHAFGLGVDLGLNYFDEERDFSASFTLRNMGAQLKDFYEGQSGHLPFNMTLGFTKGLESLPVRLNVTLTDLTRWKKSYYFHASDEGEMSNMKMALNHLVLGMDVLPTDWLYLSLGYNVRRGNELKSAGASKWAGLTAGVGLQLKRLKFGASYAKYHVGFSSLQFSVAYSLDNL